MLRQAPNIILVGEIRDKETAEIAIQAALTGHLVFSTLHTNDAPSALTRLIDMGVKPFLVSAAVHGGDRAAPRAAAVPGVQAADDRPDAAMLAALGLTADDSVGQTIYRAGLPVCGSRATAGRSGSSSCFEMDAALREADVPRREHAWRAPRPGAARPAA